MSINIAIDGPAGAGKSTIAKRVASALNYIYIDTGAMYRTLAIHFLRNNINSEDTDTMIKLCDQVQVEISFHNGIQQLILNGENVTSFLRTEEVGNMASACSVIPEVRRKLTIIQQKMAENHDVVMDGRDIGTCVLPKADVKVFLTASADVRAQRRYKEITEKGEAADINRIREDIIQRDYRDSNRKHAPLRQAEDAVLIDSSNMTIEEVSDSILRLVKEKL